MKYFSSYLIALVLLVMSGCAYNPYRSTNRDHKRQVKFLSKTISQYPLKPIQSDSIRRPPYFAGTTNLNLRRPSFVIIHHTAQNSCSQTLRTFTLPRTQVSAHYVICKDKEVVVDNGLVTSRSPRDLDAFNRKLIEELAEGIHTTTAQFTHSD